MVYIYIISITLNYRHTPYIKVAYTNCFTSSLNTFAGKIIVSNSGIPFAYLSIDGKLCYNNNLFLNKSINLTSTSL